MLITQFYPPSDMVAARRPAGLAKGLEHLGHRVTVLTSGAWGEVGDDDEPATAVVRTGDLMASRLNWRRDQLRAWTGESGAAEYRAGASRLARVIVPDVALVTWLPYLLASGRRLLREERFDCVITTSGPESVHLAGAALRRRGPAWIADLRDGWGFETLHNWPTGLQRSLDARLERRAMLGADAVSAVTEPIAADIRERFGVDAWTVTNGFDPDETPAGDETGDVLAEGRHTLFHSGRMASSQRSPGPLLDAMGLLREREPETAERLELLLAGPVTAEERAMAERDGAVRLLGNLARERVLALQRQADSLLLLTAGNRRGEATGKLYEYLAAERPILVLGDRTEAARIVRETGAGLVAPLDDPEAIADALVALCNGEPLPPAQPEASREQYTYPAIAARMAELVEVACERRAAHRKRSE